MDTEAKCEKCGHLMVDHLPYGGGLLCPELIIPKTAPSSPNDAIERIREMLADAEAEAKESHAESPNTYAAGLDRGLADGLQAALAELVSE